jgi:DNA-binding response OmpR family regulator
MYERVLVIDDSQEIREFLCEYILQPKGFEVMQAANGLDRPGNGDRQRAGADDC